MNNLGVNEKNLPIIWFTGLSGAGKSTLAEALSSCLREMSHPVYILDGDKLRNGLNKDLGFSDADRVENIRRAGEVSLLMLDAGFIVLAAFISPFRHDREMLKELISSDRFVEVYVNTPLMVCEQRDVKGLYKKARSGLIKNFTGIDSVYEPPEEPSILVDTSASSIDESVRAILRHIFDRGFLKSS